MIKEKPQDGQTIAGEVSEFSPKFRNPQEIIRGNVEDLAESILSNIASFSREERSISQVFQDLNSVGNFVNEITNINALDEDGQSISRLVMISTEAWKKFDTFATPKTASLWGQLAQLAELKLSEFGLDVYEERVKKETRQAQKAVERFTARDQSDKDQAEYVQNTIPMIAGMDENSLNKVLQYMTAQETENSRRYNDIWKPVKYLVQARLMQLGVNGSTQIID